MRRHALRGQSSTYIWVSTVTIAALQPNRRVATEGYCPGLFIHGYSNYVAESSDGDAKLKIREMGSRYFFIVAYVWLEKYFSRGDYRRVCNERKENEV
jgi:hypothetical protein